jgi:SHOCT-like domain
MSDELNTVLRLVAEGKLSPEEAAPIIDALTTERPRRPEREPRPERPPRDERARRVRIQVSEGGRRVVDVRVPLAFAAMAARMVPGIPDHYASLIKQAVDSESTGTIVDAEDENGDGVLISLE